MHVAAQPKLKAPPTLADLEARLAELVELTGQIAEAQQPRIVRSKLSVAEKVALIGERGADEYLRLPYA